MKFKVLRPKVGDQNFDYSQLNVNMKMRDLEAKIIDLKSQMERKILKIIEENPKRILHQLRMFEEKEAHLWANNFNKLNKNNENLQVVQMDNKINNDSMRKMMFDMARRIEELSYKNIEVRRKMEALNTQSKVAFENNVLAIESKNSKNSNIDDMSNEIKMLKERLKVNEDQKGRFYTDMMKQYKNLNDMMIRNNQNNHQKLRRQKDDLLIEYKTNKQQTKNLEEIRMGRMMGDNEYMKGLVSSLERKIKDEIQKRIGQEYDNKQWIERQLHVFKDDIKNDEKHILENENVFVKEVQETVSSLNTIVKNTREQLEANIASTQVMMTENLRNVAKTMEVLKNNLFTKIGLLDSSLVEVNKRMSLTVEAFNEHSITTNKSLETEFQRMSKINGKMEQHLKTSLGEIRKDIDSKEVIHNTWKKNFEDKNHTFFKELTNALRILKSHIKKEKHERKTTDENLLEMIEGQKGYLLDKIVDAKNHFDHLGEIFDFKLNKNNEQWENNLQIEVDKILDSLEQNNDYVRKDYMRNIKISVLDSQEKMEKEILARNGDVREFVLKKKGEIEDSYLEGMSDLNVKLSNTWTNKFNSYKIQFEDAIHDFNSLKNDLSLIKTDYYNAMSRLEGNLDHRISRDFEESRGKILKQLKEQKAGIIKYIEQIVDTLRSDLDLNSADVNSAIMLVKENLRGESNSLKSELIRKLEEQRELVREQVLERKKESNADMNLQKIMLIERMNEMNEATKSLTRALVLKEAAGRAQEDEHIIKLIERKMMSTDQLFQSLIGQTESNLRLEFNKKFKDNGNDFDEFKNWTIGTVSDLRTEDEEFKQDVYAREYTDHLMRLAFQKDTGDAIIEIRQNFLTLWNKLGTMEDKFGGDSKSLQELIEKERDMRKKDEVAILSTVDENNIEFKEYKELNEETWKEHIAENNAQFYYNSIKASLVEENLFEQMKNLLGDIGNLGGDFTSLYKKIDEFETNATGFRDKTNKRFGEFKEKVVDMDDKASRFYKASNNNFEITEESLFRLRNFVNELDARFTSDEMINRCCFSDIEQKTASEFAVMNQQVDLQAQKVKEELEQQLHRLERKITEDVIPTQILSLNNNNSDIKNRQSLGFSELTDKINSRISEQNLKLEDHGSKIRINKANVEMLQEDMERASNAVADANAEYMLNKFMTQADIGELRDHIKNSVKDIFKSVDDVEKTRLPFADTMKNFGVKDDPLDDVRDDLDIFNERFKKLEKGQASVGDLYKRLDNIDQTIKSLQEDKGNLKENEDTNEIIERKVNELKKLDELREGLDELRNKVKNLENMLKEGAPFPKDKDNEKEDKGQNDKIEEELRGMKTDIKKNQKELKALKGHNTSTLANKHRRDDDDDDDEGLEDRIDKLEDEIEELKKKQSKEPQEMKDNNGSEDETDDSLKEEISDLKDKVKNLEKLKISMDKLEDDADKLRVSVVKLGKDVEDIDERVKYLEEEEPTEKKSVDKHDSRNRSADAGEKADKEEFDELKKKVNELEEKLNEKGDKKVDSEEFGEMKEKIQDLEGKVKYLKGKEEDGNDEDNIINPELQEKVEELEEKIDELENKIDEKGSEDNDDGELKERINDLEEKIEELENKGEKSEDDGDLKKQVEEMKERQEEMDEKIEELENRGAKGSEDSSEDNTEKIEELETQIEELREEVEDLKGGGEGYNPEEFEDLKDRVDNFDDVVEKVSEMEAKLADLEEKLEELMDEA